MNISTGLLRHILARPVALQAAVLFAIILPATARATTTYKGWDPQKKFHMILNVEMSAGRIKLLGGDIENSAGLYMQISPAAGSLVPQNLGASSFAGDVLFSQAGGSVTATLFTGTLSGAITDGAITATGVRFQAYNQTQDLTFVLTVNGAPTPTPTTPHLNPIGVGILHYPSPTPTMVFSKLLPAGPKPLVPTPVPGPVRVLYDNTNVGGIACLSNPSLPLLISSVSLHITQIYTNHWNYGHGEPPGTISLVNIGTGETYGPWPAAGSPGSYNVPNVDWNVQVNQDIPAGSYHVIDSSPSTWSENLLSHNAGFAKVWGW
jgi:hypothetical protein